MRALKLLLVVSAIGVAGCADDPELVAPTSLGSTAPPALVVTDTVTGAAIGNAAILRHGSRVTVEASGYLTRETSAASRVDLIPTAAPFDIAFYRALVRNGYEAPSELQPLRRQPANPRFYVRTVDEGGAPVPTALVDSAVAVMRTADAYTGGRLTTATVERGTDTREGQSDWVTVKWLSSTDTAMCGRAPVGGGWIELNYLNPLCRCGGSAFSVAAMRHELGHVMGFWHTDSTDDLMFHQIDRRCDKPLSARERFHTALAYQRPIGNRDQDVDPAGGSSMGMRPAIVID
jgi:hypothetical protein